jgi:SDR family mycofactocin-dependent oxidoreductase
MGSLDGRVALVTGAARGQGRSHAVALAGEGADVAALDVPRPMTTPTYPLATRADLEETADLVGRHGRRCLPIEADVRDAAAVDAAVKQILADLGRVDIVVANAGIVTTGPLVDVTDQEWDEMMATNLTGVFNTLRAVLPPLREQRWGRIVVTSSMGGRMGIPQQAAYNATKWGVIGLAKSLALEVAKEGITVNVVCPTTAQTPMVQPYPDQEPPDDLVQRFMRSNPIPQPWIQAADVSRAVLYLVTDPGVLTGTVLDVSLGSSARMAT